MTETEDITKFVQNFLDTMKVYGIEMTIDENGKETVREFGNAGKPDVREPLTDVSCANGKVTVVVELPGVEKSDINLECADNVLKISVDTEKKKFAKSVKLPEKVESDSVVANYNNGLLEVVFDVRKDAGKKIAIN